MKRVLVIGASGFIGAQLFEHLAGVGYPAIGSYLRHEPSGAGDRFARLDVRDAGAVAALFARTAPEIVVHAAANKDVVSCERDPAAAHLTNVLGTENVARACREHGARLIWLSADYVFDGRTGRYVEEDEPHPVNVYGETKVLGEGIVGRMVADHVIVRPSNVYGLGNTGFLAFVLKGLRAHRPLPVFRDSLNSPTSALDLCRAVGDLAASDFTGTLHVAGPVRMSRLEYAMAIARAFDLDPSPIEGVDAETFQEPLRRPPDSSLDSGRHRRLFGWEWQDPEAGLRMLRVLLDRREAGGGSPAGNVL